MPAYAIANEKSKFICTDQFGGSNGFGKTGRAYAQSTRVVSMCFPDTAARFTNQPRISSYSSLRRYLGICA